MQSDEEQIRQFITTWMAATASGDVDAVMALMSEDVVFLVPGQSPMGKSAFAKIAKAQAGPAAPKIVGSSDIQEIKVLGDWAFMWTKLSVDVTPPGDAPPLKRAGHTLSVLKKEKGRWLLARDANLLAPVPR